MTTIITRLYDTAEKAADAKKALGAFKWAAGNVDMIAGGEGGADAVLECIRGAGVYPKAAAVYAEKVAAGGALVVCRAPFGCALQAEAVMDNRGPVAVPGIRHSEVYVESRNPPVKRYRYLPELIDYPVVSGGLFPRAVITGDWHATGGLLSSRVPKVNLVSRTFSPFPLLTSGKPLMTSMLPRSGPIMTGPLH